LMPSLVLALTQISPKNPTKKKSKPRAKKKKDELPSAKDLIKDIEKELFGKDK